MPERLTEKISHRSAEMVCPHCQTKGTVKLRNTRGKRGVSGGKVVAAFLTLGVSILFIGLSRKEATSIAKCGNCGAKWSFSRG